MVDVIWRRYQWLRPDERRLIHTSVFNEAPFSGDWFLEKVARSLPVKEDGQSVEFESFVSAVKHLILTNKGERPFQPNLGTDINRLLFENIDVGIAARLSEEIEALIKGYEPRVELDSVTVTPDYDNNGFSAEINFYIIGIPYLQTVDMFLESTR